MGSFRVRAHAGVNRVPFRGRVRGRALAAGTYRLLLRVEGAKQDAADVTIVVARGKTSAKKLKRARRASVCGIEDTVWSGAFPASSDPWAAVDTSSAGTGGSGNDRIEAPVAEATKALARKAKVLTSRFEKSVQDSAPTGPLFLVVVGLLTLATALLGALVLLRLLERTGFRDRFYR